MNIVKRKFKIIFKGEDIKEDNKYNLFVNLTSSFNHIGLQSNVQQEWINGKCYNKNQQIIYQNEIYTAKEKTCGFFDDCTKIIEFDNNKWERTNFPYTNIENFSCECESRLKEFKLNCSVDNLGNEMHGIVPSDYDFSSKKTLMLELPYKEGTVSNISILDIPYIINNEKKYKVFGNKLSLIEELKDENCIVFTYIIGAIMKLNENNEYIIDETSKNYLTFVEKYKVEIEKEVFFIREDTCTLAYYINLIPIKTQTYQVVGTNIDNTIPIADVVYTDYSKYNDKSNLPTLTLEENVEIAYPDKVQKEVIITRGTSNFFERHLILGNVKTFEALEQYSNGYYKIIDNNNL